MSGPNYNANLVKKAQRFANAQMASQRTMQQDVIVPKLGLDKVRAVGDKYFDTQLFPGLTITGENILNNNALVSNILNSRYDYSYQIPEETRFDVKRRFTDNNGFAKYNLLGQEKQIGQVHVGSEYWDFVVKEMDREEAMGLKAFIFNTMIKDFNRPTGKMYWKKRCPELFEELRQALIFKHQNQFNKAMVALNEPQTIEEWRFVYDQFAVPNYYGTTQVLDDAVPGDQYNATPGFVGLPTSENLNNQGIYNIKGSNKDGDTPVNAKVYDPRGGVF